MAAIVPRNGRWKKGSAKGTAKAEQRREKGCLLILRILSIEPLHGYGIVQRLQQMSRDALQVRQGSLYPALYRMEARGLLEPEWRTHEGGREAKYYKLTKAGRKALEVETENWKRLRGVMDLVLEG